MKRIISLISLLSLSILLAPAALFAHWGSEYGCENCWGSGMHYRFYHGGWIMGIVAIILLVVIIYFGVRLLKGGNLFTPGDPMAILKARYARGEITKDQFEEIKKNL